jgi:hypothetical protein
MFRTCVTQSVISYHTTRLIVDCILDRFLNIPPQNALARSVEQSIAKRSPHVISLTGSGACALPGPAFTSPTSAPIHMHDLTRHVAGGI